MAVTANSGEVNVGEVNGVQVIVVGPDSSDSDRITVDDFGHMSTISGPAGITVEVHDESGKQGEVDMTCRANWCDYGSKINWSDKTVSRWDSPSFSFSGDKIAIAGDGASPPSGWDEVDDYDSLEVSMSVLEGLPSSMCPGDSTTVEVGVDQQAGLENISGDIVLVNNLTGEEQRESFNVNIEAGTKRSFSYTVPSDVDAVDGPAATVRVESNADNQPSKEISSNIGASPSEISVGSLSISKTGTMCPGSRIQPTLQITNNSNCNPSLAVTFSNSVNDQSTTESEQIQSGSSTEFTNRTEVPTGASPDSTINYTAEVTSSGTKIDTKRLDVSVGSASLSLISAGGPTKVCAGESFRLEAEAKNSGTCEGRGRIKISNPDTGFDQVVESDSVRSGSSLRARVERTIGDATLDSTTYTIELQEYNGTEYVTQQTREVDVEVGSANLSFNTINVPDNICPGKSFTANLQYSNEGDCEGRVRARVTDNITEESKTGSPKDVRPGRSSSSNFSYTLPIDNYDKQFKLQTIIETPTESGWETLSKKETKIPINQIELQFNGIDSPDGVCVGEEFQVSTNIRNPGVCETESRVLVRNGATGNVETTDSEVLQSSSEVVKSVTTSLPESSLSDTEVDLDIEIQAALQGAFETLASKTIAVNPQTFDLEIDSIEQPTSACVGEEITVPVNLRNVGNCSTSAKVEIAETSSGNTTTTKVDSITGSSGKKRIELPVFVSPSLVGEDTGSYNLIVYGDRGGKDVVEAKSSFTFDLGQSDIQVKSRERPEFKEPGTHNYGLVLENVGDCGTEANVTVNDSTYTQTVEAGGEANITHEYEIGVTSKELSVEVEDGKIGTVKAEFTVEIDPHKYVHLNTGAGTIDIVGGFERGNDYRGVINGTGISGSDNLETKDKVVSGLTNSAVRGQVSSRSDDVDTIKADTIQYLRLSFNQEIVWFVNGQKQEKARSFTFESPASKALSLKDKIDPDLETDIQYTGTILSNLGLVRRKANIRRTPLAHRML